MADGETDYLVIGAGAVGLAFVDTLLDELPDVHITLVDRHARPGGHWNDAYSFVALHQPSAFYGVNSTDLGDSQLDTHGPNQGLFPLASGAEISAYFEQLVNRRFLPSGRVSYLPLSEYRGDGRGEARIVSMLSGNETQIAVQRKTVDATAYQTSVPATHTRKFQVADSVRVVIPGALPDLWMNPADLPVRYVILGGGKTAMDTAVWLLRAGVLPDAITWVRPRDSWLINRRYTQPGPDFFEDVVAHQVAQLNATVGADSGDTMFSRLEADGHMLRIDPAVTPEMFHYATISEGEIALLRTITDVIRQGRVTGIEPGAMQFGAHSVAVPGKALYIDCTATAVDFAGYNALEPQYQGDRIVLRALHVPLVTLSAAVSAFVEANYDNDDAKNALTRPGPLTDTPNTYPLALLNNLMNRRAWSQDPKLATWLARARLDPLGPTVARMMADGDTRLQKLGSFQQAAMQAMPDLMRLAAQARSQHVSR